MRNVIIATIVAFGLVACGDYAGDSSYSEYNDNSGQDLSTNYGEGTVITCTDANCSVVEDNSDNSDNSKNDDQNDSFTGDAGDAGSYVVGDYPGPNVSQSLCNSLGFFYCTISNTCNNVPRNGSGGTCNR